MEAYDRLSGGPSKVCDRPLLGRFLRGVAGERQLLPGDQDGRPDPLVMASVVDIVDRLASGEQAEGWLRANLFVPDASTRAGLNELDEAVREGLGSLTDVCRRPHDRLEHVTELVRVGLARRVPPVGLTRLASHAEDWAGIEHGRLRPAKVLSTRYSDDFDFYENRVAAQLVDRLDEYLAARIRELRMLGAGFTDLDEYDCALSHRQSWRKQERLAHLVAAAVDDRSASAALIRESLAELTKVRSSLQLLLDSVAVRKANRHVRLPMRLMRTNLFVNDGRYRAIGRLWETWASHETEAVERRRDADSRFFDAYNRYVAILTVRSLSVLGYLPQGDAALPREGSRIRFERGHETLRCTVDDTGVITLSADGNEITRVVPLGHDLTASITDRLRRHWTHQLGGASPSVLVYPGVRSGRQGLSDELRAELHSSLRGIVPVTPLEIEGEERLARALRWPVQGDRYWTHYPPVLKVGKKPTAAGWYHTNAVNELKVVRWPTKEEAADFVAKMTTVSPRVRERTASADLEAMLSAVELKLSFVASCPICAEPTMHFVPRDRLTFRCSCANCSAVWGLNQCGNCERRFPFLRTRNAVIDVEDGDHLDMTAGADLLAEPCRSEPNGARFRCSWCGHCSGMPLCRCSPRQAGALRFPSRPSR